MEKISVAITALVMVIAMIAAGAFSSGSVLLANAKDDSSGGGGNSDSGNGSGSSNGGSGDNSDNGGSGSSAETPEAKPAKPAIINNPQHPGKEDNKDISDIPEENGAHCLTNECPKPITHPNEQQQPPPGQCMIPEGCPSPSPPIIIKITKVIHETHTSSSNGNSGHSLSKACFDAIKIAWFGKVHRGQNHEVDKFIDKCLT